VSFRFSLGLWVLVSVAALVVAAPSSALSILGTEVLFSWDYEEGAPAPEGWRVSVSRNDQPYMIEQTVTEQEVTVSGEVGETVAIFVTAFLGEAQRSSEPSEAVTFQQLGAIGPFHIGCSGGRELIDLGDGWFDCQ